jgi:hypothetical protein
MAESTALTTAAQPTELGFLSSAAATFEGVLRLAELMAKCGTLPVHLKNPADCFRVVVQAAKWNMDPFVVAECTSLVHGRLCYEGKLVAAALLNRGIGRLDYEITGKGQDSAVVVSGTPKGGRQAKSVSGSVREWRTKQMKDGREIPNNWDKDPHSMLVYRGTRQWARLWAPEVMAGVYTPDELDDVREVEATVVHTDPPAARTAAPAATENGGAAQHATEQPSGEPPTGSSASAGGQSPAAGLPPAHPALEAARILHRTIGKERGNMALIGRLCAIHGGKTPLAVPTPNLDAFGADVAKVQAVASDADQTLELIAKLEVDAAEAAREAAVGGGK